jgi:predicted short-subunit dehydrogenase-like oxidoreductase (DUF2520 family)
VEVILVGPGNAGLSVCLALSAAGHQVSGVLGRSYEELNEAAGLLPGIRWLEWDEPLPPADLLVIAVSDRAIAEVAGRLAPGAGAVRGAVHLSGLTPVAALGPLEPSCPVGSFHPLQTLPNPRDGAARLKGAWVAVTCRDDGLFHLLVDLADSIGCHPFSLADDRKALYHAAASAAANYPVAALAMARRLFEAAGVGFGVAEPLVRAAVENALSLGPEAALTGPAARGDAGTVAAQVEAVRRGAPELAEAFIALARAAARLAGTEEAIAEALQ